jgi:hypothetical protein
MGGWGVIPGVFTLDGTRVFTLGQGRVEAPMTVWGVYPRAPAQQEAGRSKNQCIIPTQLYNIVEVLNVNAGLKPISPVLYKRYGKQPNPPCGQCKHR